MRYHLRMAFLGMAFTVCVMAMPIAYEATGGIDLILVGGAVASAILALTAKKV